MTLDQIGIALIVTIPLMFLGLLWWDFKASKGPKGNFKSERNE